MQTIFWVGDIIANLKKLETLSKNETTNNLFLMECIRMGYDMLLATIAVPTKINDNLEGSFSLK